MHRGAKIGDVAAAEKPPAAFSRASTGRARAGVGPGLLLALLGCAGESVLPGAEGRRPVEDARPLPLDAADAPGRDGGSAGDAGGGSSEAGLADAGPADAGPADAAPADAAPPPDRRRPWRTFAIQWFDPPEAGLRAALEPPQVPGPPPDAAALAPQGLWVAWDGPDGSGEVALNAQAASMPVAPLWDLASRPEGPEVLAAIAADGRWLAARHLGPDRLHLGAQPLLAVRGWQAHPARWAAARAAFVGLPVRPAWVLEVSMAGPPALPAEAAGLFPAEAHGHAPAVTPGPGEAGGPPEARSAVPEPALEARLAAWQAAAAGAGVAWFARARPGRNPRLALPTAAAESPALDAWRRSLVLARRAAGPTEALLLDGLGAWADDRQLDAVAGVATTEPLRLTEGRPWPPYGAERIALAWALLHGPLGDPPGVLPPPPLTTLAGGRWPSAQARVEGLGPESPEAGVPPTWVGRPLVVVTVTAPTPDGGGAPAPGADDDRPAGGVAERLLWDAGAVVPGESVLAGWRDVPWLAVDVVFADGGRLLAERPDLRPTTLGVFRMPLGAFAGRAVAEVVLEIADPDATPGPAPDLPPDPPPEDLPAPAPRTGRLGGLEWQ